VGPMAFSGMMIFMVLVPLLLILLLTVLLVLFFRRPASVVPGGPPSWAELTPAVADDDRSERNTFLIVPDITGYTRFLSLNRFSVGHAQHIVSELLGALIRQGAPLLVPSKIEGDAILFYADASPQGGLQGKELGAALVDLLTAFYGKREQLQKSNLCPCKACGHIGDLDLKIFVHRGPVLRYRLGGFYELSGLPVIAVHRLLKSSLALTRYLMVSDIAVQHCRLPENFAAQSHIESYEGIGEVASRVYAFDPADLPKIVSAGPVVSRKARGRDMLRKLLVNAQTLARSIRFGRA
jgi:Protein of unknown function (DUF2652)